LFTKRVGDIHRGHDKYKLHLLACKTAFGSFVFNVGENTKHHSLTTTVHTNGSLLSVISAASWISQQHLTQLHTCNWVIGQ